MLDSDLQSGGGFNGDGGGNPNWPNVGDPYAQIRALYQQITGGKYTPTDADVSQWGTNIDSNYYSKIQNAIQNWWSQKQAEQPATPTAAPVAPTPPPPATSDAPAPGTTAGTQTAPDIFNSPLTAPYPGTFTTPPPAIPGIPTFTGANAPPTFSAPAFTPPSLADLMNNPAYAGYQFGQKEGERGIQDAAAARGTLNDSSTFKALSDYNVGNAEQYAGGIYNQALNTYDTNLNSQYVMPYQANYTNWLQGIVNPTMTAYGAQNAQANTNYQDVYSQFLNNQNYYTNWQNNVWSKLFQSATA